MFALNLLLALTWTLLTGVPRPANFLLGFALGYAALWLVRDVAGPSTYFEKPRRIARFVSFFLWELVRANLRVAYEVVTPKLRMRPGIVAIPLDLEGDAAITLLANLVTLTPGALSLDVSPDRTVLYVHTMYMDDAETFRREIKQGFERRVKELLR
jgi:multicomponent Na+:H+ antiporter subunit E